MPLKNTMLSMRRRSDEIDSVDKRCFVICPTCRKPGYKPKVVSPKMEFVKIPAGEFQMGSPPDEAGRFDDEVLHHVKIAKPFEMQTTPVTQRQYEVMGVNPSYFKGDDLPVETVSWDDAQAFIAKLNASQKKYVYRLPTEAEWEYAARAGTQTPYPFDADKLDDYAWYYNNSENKTHPVGTKKPNPWGLYDMFGNVLEWCQDFYGPYPDAPVTGSYRVIRGGSFGIEARYLRSALRDDIFPGGRSGRLGFRLVRSRR